MHARLIPSFPPVSIALQLCHDALSVRTGEPPLELLAVGPAQLGGLVAPVIAVILSIASVELRDALATGAAPVPFRAVLHAGNSNQSPKYS